MVKFNAINNAVENEEGQANPYNANKNVTGETQDVERGLQGANDSMAYVTPKKATTVISTPEGVQPLINEDNNSGSPKATQVEPNTTIEESQDGLYNKVDYKKRYDDLKKHYDNKLNQFKSDKEALEATIKANQPKFIAPKTPDELATFREDYPDVFDVIETVAHSRAEAQVEDLSAKVEALQERENTLAKREAEQELLKLHPDFIEIREDANFHEWAKLQPEEIQGWIYSNGGNAYLAARAIDLYKTDQGIKPQPKEVNEVSTNEVQVSALVDNRGSAADAVSVATANSGQPIDNAPKVWTQAEIAAMSPAQYERMMPELDQAFIEGRVVA